MAYLYERFNTLAQFGAIQNKHISLIEVTGAGRCGTGSGKNLKILLFDNLKQK